MFPDIGHPDKKCTIVKGTLPKLLPMHIIHIIDMWIIGLEHCKNFNAVVKRINIPHNPVLYVDTNQACKTYYILW